MRAVSPLVPVIVTEPPLSCTVLPLADFTATLLPDAEMLIVVPLAVNELPFSASMPVRPPPGELRVTLLSANAMLAPSVLCTPKSPPPVEPLIVMLFAVMRLLVPVASSTWLPPPDWIEIDVPLSRSMSAPFAASAMILPLPGRLTTSPVAEIWLPPPVANRPIRPPAPLKRSTILELPAAGSMPNRIDPPFCAMAAVPNGTSTVTPFAVIAPLPVAVIRPAPGPGGTVHAPPLLLYSPPDDEQFAACAMEIAKNTT